MTAERITTAAELDALPARSAVLIENASRGQRGVVAQRDWVTGLWYFAGGTDGFTADRLEDGWVATVLRIPGRDLIAEAEARGAREALTEASQLVDEAAWLTHPIFEESDYWTALDDVVKELDRLARGESARSCTCPHYVVDHSDPEQYHPENVDREDDPSCPVHGAHYRARPGRRRG